MTLDVFLALIMSASAVECQAEKLEVIARAPYFSSVEQCKKAFGAGAKGPAPKGVLEPGTTIRIEDRHYGKDRLCYELEVEGDRVFVLAGAETKLESDDRTGFPGLRGAP